MRKLLVLLGFLLSISSSLYSQCPVSVWTSASCGGHVDFTFNPSFFSSWNMVSYTADFGDGVIGSDSIALDSAEWVIQYTYTSNGIYNAVFSFILSDTLTPGATCSTTVSTSVSITSAGPPSSSCSVPFTTTQICTDSIIFIPNFGSLTCGYYYTIGSTITNLGDTLPVSCRLPTNFIPWPSSVNIYYNLMQAGNPIPILQCSSSVAVPAVQNVQLDLYVDTMGLPMVVIHDTSSINMYFNNVDWGDGNTYHHVGDYSANHTYVLDGIYLIDATAIPSNSWNWWDPDSSLCPTNDTIGVQIRGISNSSSCNLNSVVNYIGTTQELDFSLQYASQIVSSSHLDVQWTFSNGMSSNYDFGNFSGVSPTPATYTVNYQIYDFWGNQVCTNSITNSVNSIYPSCNALTYIYEDSLTPGLYWAQDLSSGGMAPYSYLWDFGDGSTSNLQFPTHTYSTSGYYTVCLTITDSQTPACVSTFCVDSVGTLVFDDNLVTRSSSPMSRLNVYNPAALGVNEISSDDLHVFPNPTSNIVYIKSDHPLVGDISIIDIAGKEIQLHISNLNGVYQLDLTEKTPGIYFIRFSDGSNSVVKKIMKE